MLFAAVFLVSCCTLFLAYVWNPQGQTAIVEVDGLAYARLQLRVPQQLAVMGKLGKMIITVRDGRVAVTESHCPQKVCMHSGAISRNGDLLVCVPNRVVIRILGNAPDSFDMITQ